MYIIQMPKINLPKEILELTVLKSLPAKEKEEYVNNLLKRVLDLNPDGVTISQIKEATGLASSTIWHHLEILKSTAQSRKISHGNNDVYHTYGKEEHQGDYNKGNARFSVSIVENEEGKFVCIHDMRKNRLDSYTVVRGVAIPFEIVDDIISELSKINGRDKKK